MGDGYGAAVSEPGQVELSRTLRFFINPAGQAAGGNGFGGRPACVGWGLGLELEVVCTGVPEPRSGYVVNIQAIDAAARAVALPQIDRAVREAWRAGAEAGGAHAASGGSSGSVEGVLRASLAGLSEALGGAGEGRSPLVVQRLALRPSPTVVLMVLRDAGVGLRVAQQYDFAAAHRLHVPELSEADNHALFGKCGNPSGHGHNYRVEVVVEAPPGAWERRVGMADLDAAVDRALIQPLDHKHLNLDVPYFRSPGSPEGGQGMNPSVEHLTRFAFEALRGGLPDPLRLLEVSVWETDRTRCTLRGSGAG